MITHHVFVKKIRHRSGRDWLPIDGQALVQVGQLVPGHPNHALDVVQAGLGRVAKHHHITTLGLAAFAHLDIEHRQAQAVVEFVHQYQVADQQGRDHGAGGYLEGLKQKRAQQEHRQNHREQAGSPIEPPGLRQHSGPGLGAAVINLGDAELDELLAPLQRLGLQQSCCFVALWQKIKALSQPVGTGDERSKKQQQGEIALHLAQIPGPGIS